MNSAQTGHTERNAHSSLERFVYGDGTFPPFGAVAFFVSRGWFALGTAFRVAKQQSMSF